MKSYYFAWSICLVKTDYFFTSKYRGNSYNMWIKIWVLKNCYNLKAAPQLTAPQFHNDWNCLESILEVHLLHSDCYLSLQLLSEKWGQNVFCHRSCFVLQGPITCHGSLGKVRTIETKAAVCLYSLEDSTQSQALFWTVTKQSARPFP